MKDNITTDNSLPTKEVDKGMDTKKSAKRGRSPKMKSTKYHKANKSSKKPYDKVASGTFNDVEWYNISSDITGPAANIPFNVFNGVDYSIYRFNNTVDTISPRNVVIPGVLVYKYIPWYGNSDETSALNVAMRGLFSHLRKVNAGRTNYEAPDLMEYIMAMDNMYLRIHEVRRLLKLVSYYNSVNRTIPKQLFIGMNIDLDDAVSHYNDYRGRLNIIISMVNSLAVPKAFTLFSRRAVLGSSVLTDEVERPTQLILPQTDGYWKYDPTGKTGGKFNYIPYNTSSRGEYSDSYTRATTYVVKYDVNTIGTLLHDMTLDLNALLANQDINIMAGDIMKAYEGDVYTLPYLAENESLDFIYDENLAQQFRSATVLDIPTASYSQHYHHVNGTWDETFLSGSSIWFKTADGLSPIPTITQANNALICKLYTRVVMTGTKGPLYTMLPSMTIAAIENQFMDVNTKPTPEMVIEWSRLMMVANPQPENLPSGQYNEIYVGTEIGLGFLYVIGRKEYLPTGGNYHNHYSDYITAQWYQRGAPDIFEYHMFENPSKGEALVFGSTKYGTGVVAGHSGYSIVNHLCVHNAVMGFKFGPRNYPVYNVSIEDLSTSKPYPYEIATPSLSLGVYTALISPCTLRGLHDVAILGLLAKSFTRG